MAAASSTCRILLLQNPRSTLRHSFKCVFPCHRSRSFASGRVKKSSTKDLAAVNAIPEKVGDALSSLFQPGTEAFSDNPWFSLIAALFIAVPLIQKLVAVTKQVDTAAQSVAKIGETVGRVAEDVDKAREDISKSLVDLTSGLRKVVTIVEDLAKDSLQDAEKVDDLIDKVEELEDKLDKLIGKKCNGSGKAKPD